MASFGFEDATPTFGSLAPSSLDHSLQSVALPSVSTVPSASDLPTCGDSPSMKRRKHRLTFSATKAALAELLDSDEEEQDCDSVADKNQALSGMPCGRVQGLQGASGIVPLMISPASSVASGSQLLSPAFNASVLPPPPQRPVRRSRLPLDVSTRRPPMPDAEHRPAPMTPPRDAAPGAPDSAETALPLRRLSGFKRTREERESIGASARAGAMAQTAARMLAGTDSEGEEEASPPRSRTGITRDHLDDAMMTSPVAKGGMSISLDQGMAAKDYDRVRSAVRAAEVATRLEAQIEFDKRAKDNSAGSGSQSRNPELAKAKAMAHLLFSK